jgi:multisubunit Na+/H+ antiporter MnhG subunit
MNFDLRFPIGLLFTLFGLLLTGFGVVTKGDPDLYRRSLGINVNLWWGLFLLLFGLVMLFLSRRGRR